MHNSAMPRKDMTFQPLIVYSSIPLAIVLGLHADGIPSFPAQDAFHNGEFVAAAVTALQGAPFDGVAYTIHGAVDILPALAANLFVPDRDMLLATTLVLYPILTMCAVVFTALASIQLGRRFGVAPVLMVPFILIAGLCVGWRDFFFALSLYIFARIVQDDLARGGGTMAQILFGLVIAFGTYWSFNRGAAALIAFGPPTLWLAMQYRRYVISITTAILGFLAIGSSIPGISVQGYLENIVMLSQASSQWKHPRTLSQDLWWVLIVGMTVSAIAVAALNARRGARSIAQIVLIVALLIASAVYAKIGLGRIDQTHIVMGCWLPLLVVTLHLSPVHLRSLSGLQFGIATIAAVVITYVSRNHVATWPMAATLIITFAVLFGDRIRAHAVLAMAALCLSVPILAAGKTWVNVNNGTFAWLRELPNLPPAEQAVTSGILWSATSLRESGAHCVFDLVNVGLINAVANLPACSRFTYPVYAGPQHEERLIADLQRTLPTAIVYKADYWSYAIDGRSMDVRFPALDSQILRLYPREECNLGFCLRFRK